MTLERVGPLGARRLVTCPFCGADLRPADVDVRRRRAADHLAGCEAFREAWGHDARV